MLELRPNCECCDKDLPPQADALICTYECTFCRDCGENVLKGVCPNCGGNLVTRPNSADGEAPQGPRLDHAQSEARRLHESSVRLNPRSPCPTMYALFAT